MCLLFLEQAGVSSRHVDLGGLFSWVQVVGGDSLLERTVSVHYSERLSALEELVLEKGLMACRKIFMIRQ